MNKQGGRRAEVWRKRLRVEGRGRHARIYVYIVYIGLSYEQNKYLK